MSDLNYTIFGDGDRDILLVHGWFSSNQMWAHVHPFIHNARCWAIDLRGFGQTPAGSDPPDVDEHVRSVIAFCDDHQLKPQVIIAHSMGGLITLKAVHQRPDLAQQLILICPVVTGNFGVNGIASELIRNEVGATMLRYSEAIWPFVQQQYLLRMAVQPFQATPYLRERTEEDLKNSDPRAAIEALVSMAQQNMQPHLTEITQPTLVCVGEQDLTVPPSEGRTAALYMPNAELALFERSRHHPMDEQTADFAPVMQEFLARFGVI